jgi:hypothetical protein
MGISDQNDRRKIRLFMYFDEAHCLHNPTLTHAFANSIKPLVYEKRTAYDAFTRALDELRTLNIFSLFLSTSSSLSKFAPTKKQFQSSRSSEKDHDLQPPITELPFDLCSESAPLATENKHTLDEICTTRFMARFGRPLYVISLKVRYISSPSTQLLIDVPERQQHPAALHEQT